MIFGSITVNGRGSAETRFSSVVYRVKAVGFGNTGPDAKAAVRPVIDKFQALIVGVGKDAGIDQTRILSRLDTGLIEAELPHRPRAQYRATYVAEFVGSDVAKAVGLHDRLTSIEGLQVPSPEFEVEDLPAVEAIAFREAFEQAKARFDTQCKAAGLDSGNFEVSHWFFNPDGQRGKALSLSPADAGKARSVSVEPGRAILELQVSVIFIRKTGVMRLTDV